MFKKLWRAYGINPLDRLLRKARRKEAARFLICWNRGLGDIALGMYALIHRIFEYLPNAQITFLTRSDLAEGFSLLKDVSVLVDPDMKRKQPFDLDASLAKHCKVRSDFDVVIESPDPTYWLKWQLGTLIPRLNWNHRDDALCTKFSLNTSKRYVGVHVQTETVYGYEKNWPEEKWNQFFDRVALVDGVEVLLFGKAPSPEFCRKGVIDLRGKTTLLEMLSLIKHRCSWLLVPDSGVLSLTYFLDCPFELKIVSLWADPHQGVLKQNVPSPNPHLTHVPLIAPEGDLSRLSVDQVMEALNLKGFDHPSIRRRQQAVLAAKDTPVVLDIAPLEKYSTSGNVRDQQNGLHLISEGKAGCIILAGGQGTRLGYQGPKGMVQVSPILSKSLFQLFCERVSEVSMQVGRPLKVAIMTSPLNHVQTCRFFQEHQFFGLEAEQIDFFQQPVLPFCDDEGNWLKDEGGSVSSGPDGNGHVFHAFAASGLWNQWRSQGIEFVSVIPVDNPLADPFDSELIGYQEQEHADVVIKAVRREHAEEKMGVVVAAGSRVRVVEYTELSSEDAAATQADGSLKYAIANAGLFSFHADFIQKVIDRQVEMPLHLARKSTLLNGKHVPIWKFETFIFDLLEHAAKPSVLLYPREKVYSPLKNAQGEKSLETVRAALLALNRH